MDEGSAHQESGEDSPPAAAPGPDPVRRAPLQPHQHLTLIALLLTACSAAADVISFTRLGSVFASVMTSNIVFLGLAAAHQSTALAVHAAISFGGYVVGVAAGAQITRQPEGDTGQGGGSASRPWTPRITAAVLAEAVLFAGFTAGWIASGSTPSGGAQMALLAVVTIAMGMQSATVRGLRLSDVSTTYMTGTLTALVSAVVSPEARAGRRRPLVLIALAGGAGLSGLLLATVPQAVPVFPLAVLIGVLVLGTTRLGSLPAEYLPARAQAIRPAVARQPRARSAVAHGPHAVSAAPDGAGN